MVAGTRSLEARPQSRPAVVPLCRLNHPLDPRTPSRAMAGSPRHRPRSPSTGRGPGHGTPVGPAERRRNGRAFRGLRAGSPRRARAQQSARRARRQVACGLESESPTAFCEFFLLVVRTLTCRIWTAVPSSAWGRSHPCPQRQARMLPRGSLGRPENAFAGRVSRTWWTSLRVLQAIRFPSVPPMIAVSPILRRLGADPNRSAGS
jgi:hypothetical protein